MTFPPEPTVDDLLDELTAAIRGALGDTLVGVYVYGSYLSGGFDPAVSDIDLVVVTSVEVDALDLVSLGRVHDDLVARHPEWTDRVEVVYIGRATLQSFRSSDGHLAVISPGEPFHVRDDPVSAWVQNWYLVRESGRAWYGPPPAVVVPVVEWAEFVAASVRYAHEIAGRDTSDIAPGALAYTVLTLCRAYMTVQTQRQVSKQEAAAWTSERLPAWSWLIDAALHCRLSRGSSGFDDARTRAAARELITLLATDIAGPGV